MTLSAFIIDDEPDAHKLLKYYAQKVDFINITGHYYTAMEAIAAMELKLPDFIFLDINMPEISGIQMLDILETKPEVIFTTAHSQYALEGYEYNICDYLLKPIRYERFLKAVEKIKKMMYPELKELPVSIKLAQQNTVVYPAEILYIEALGNYVKLHLEKGKKLVLHETMKAMETMLLDYEFIRCHKKYLLNKYCVVKVENDVCILNNGSLINIGISYKQQIKAIWNK